MNVWFINHFAIPPTRAGGTRHFTLAREMRVQGVNLTLVASSVDYFTRTETARSSGRAFWKESIDGVPFIWIRTPEYGDRILMRLRNMIQFALQVARGRWAEDIEAPNVIVGSSPSLFAAFAALRLARKLGVPFVLEVRDIWPQSLVDVGNFSPSHPGIRVMSWIERYLYRNADRIVTLLPKAAGHIATVAPGAEEKTVWVPNGVDVELASRITPPPGEEPLRLLYTGAHGAANGLDTVLDAAKLLSKEVKTGRVRFHLVGAGPAKGHLTDRVAAEGIEGVSFQNPVPKDEIHELLQTADGFLMVLRDSPVFRWGISPNKLFDYLLAARPVLFGVNTPVNPVEDARAGWTVASENAPALAAAVRELIQTPKEERIAMGKRGHSYVREHHAMNKLAKRFANVLFSLESDG